MGIRGGRLTESVDCCQILQEWYVFVCFFNSNNKVIISGVLPGERGSS